MAFRAYLAAQVDEVHRAPRDDLLSALVHAEEEGARLTLDELWPTCSSCSPPATRPPPTCWATASPPFYATQINCDGFEKTPP